MRSWNKYYLSKILIRILPWDPWLPRCSRNLARSCQDSQDASKRVNPGTSCDSFDGVLSVLVYEANVYRVFFPHKFIWGTKIIICVAFSLPNLHFAKSLHFLLHFFFIILVLRKRAAICPNTLYPTV